MVKKKRIILTQEDVKERINNYKLTRYEQETIINFNEEENMASVYTYNSSLIKKLDKCCVNFPELYQLEKIDNYGTYVSKTYIVPKRMVSVRVPTFNTLTEEQKKENSERMKKMRLEQISKNKLSKN